MTTHSPFITAALATVVVTGFFVLSVFLLMLAIDPAASLAPQGETGARPLLEMASLSVGGGF